MKHPIIKTSTLILFIGSISFFVACRAGLFNGKPSNKRMSSSKSGVVLNPEDYTVRPNDSSKSKMMSSSKSGAIFNTDDLKKDTLAKRLLIDEKDIASGKYTKPSATQILALEEEIKKRKLTIASSKVMIMHDDRLDQLIDSLIFMRKLDSLFKVVEKAKKE